MAKQRYWHITGWPAFLLAPIAIPAVVVVLILQRLSILKSTTDLTASEVIAYLQGHLDGTEGEWDWDDFTSVPITDPFLDGIREDASSLNLPMGEDDKDDLRKLITEVSQFL